MSGALELLRQGGMVMIPITLLSCVLYERCLHLLLVLHRSRRWLKREGGSLRQRDDLRRLQADLQTFFRQQRHLIGILVAAAPLLGLLGTVMGMVETFDTLATRGTGGSVEGLARGISMALITTETGLAVAIPAVLMVYSAQRQLQKGLHLFIELDRRLLAGTPLAS